MSRERPEVYEFGPFRLDVGEHRLGRRDSSADGSLPDKAFATLVHLVRNSGILLTKGELLSAVWPDANVEENNLTKAIHAIRRFLGDINGEQKYIETVPKHGYRFVAEVKRVKDQRDAKGHAYGDHDDRQAQTFPAGSPAYDLYIRGKVKASSENRQDTMDAIKLLEAAVAVDPFFAEAYAQLARGYNTLSLKFTSDKERKDSHENAEVAVEKALALDPNLAEGHFARGLILWTNTKRFPHEQAIRSFKRSLELNPLNDETHHQLSIVYSHVGLLEAARESVGKALEINPNNTMARFRVAVYTAQQGKFEEALAILKTIPTDVSPMLIDRSRAEMLVQNGRLAEAEALVDDYLRRCPQDEGGSFTSVKALLFAKAGRSEDAEKAIRRAVEVGSDFGHFHHSTYNIASAYAILGRSAEAVSWLESTADNGFPNYPYFEIDPNLGNIRTNSRFIEFMALLKPQWERFKAMV